MKKLAIILSHPIQYYSPVFTELSKSRSLEIKVFYLWNPEKENAYDHGFNKKIVWDIPLLEGYNYEFVENVSMDPGTHHYYGIDNPELVSQVLQWNPDAILMYGWKFKSNVNFLKQINKTIPVFIRGDSHLLDEQNFLQSSVRGVVLKWIYRKINFAFYCGKNNKDYFTASGLEEHQLIWAPHSIDNKRFSYNTSDSEMRAIEIRSRLNIPAESIVVLFAGKFEEKKQPLFLLKVAEELNDSGIHFLFVGNGEYENEIKAFADHYNHIHMLPFQNQSVMPDIYRAGDIFCLPSRRNETWGLAVNEAMACSRAILVSNKVGCAADLVKNGENGFVFNYDNPEELKQILELLKDEKELIKKLGRNSSEIIKEWSIEKQAEAIERGVLVNTITIHEKEKSVDIAQ